MVALPKVHKVEDVITTSNSNVHVPDGDYVGVIVSGEMSKSPFGENKPDDLLLKVAITQGEYAHTIIEHRLGILDESPIKADNPQFTWARAAYGTLAQISKAFGMENTPSDTTEIMNKPVMFTTATRKGKDKETGAHKPQWDSTFIKQYKAVPSGGVAPQAQAQVQVVESTAGAPATNPFQSN